MLQEPFTWATFEDLQGSSGAMGGADVELKRSRLLRLNVQSLKSIDTAAEMLAKDAQVSRLEMQV